MGALVLCAASAAAPWDRNIDRIGSGPRELNISAALAIGLPRDVLLPNTRDLRWMAMWLRDYEPQHIVLIAAVLRTGCVQHDGSQSPLLVDSGANEGTWSLLAASFGCNAVAVEPQPLCVQRLLQGASRNGLSSRLAVHRNILWHSRATVTLRRTNTCSGTEKFPVRATDKRTTTFPAHASYKLAAAAPEHTVESISLDELLATGAAAPVLLWHVDVEGAEMGVLRSAEGLLAAGRIERVLIELQAERWHAFNTTAASGMELGRSLLGSWTCVISCTGKPFRWHLPLYGSAAKRLRCDARLQGKPWVLYAYDVYCVHPTLAAGDAGLRALRQLLPGRRASTR